jgi:hypothetical protein
MGWIANHDVVKNLDLEKLSRSDEITSDFDIGLGWSRIAAYAAYGISGVIPHPVLCRMAHHSPDFSGSEQLSHAA